jgi:stress-induced morphogen
MIRLLSTHRLGPLNHQIRRQMASAENIENPVQKAIRQKLETGFSSSPYLHLDVVNESHKHNVPKGSESHFNVLVVSDIFEGIRQTIICNYSNYVFALLFPYILASFDEFDHV